MPAKTAVIIGASSGIGADLARQLATKGHKLGLIARRQQLLESLAEEIGTEVEILPLDITEPNVAEVFPSFLEKLGETSLIILNAGVGAGSKTLDADAELKVVDINVCGFTNLATTSYHYFKRQGHGHLVGISSILALTPCPQAVSYAASKAYISSYIASLRGLATREGLKNITFTDIKPGFVETPMTSGQKKLFWVASSPKAAKQIIQTIEKKKDHAYITRRWRLIGWLMKITPVNWLNKFANTF